MFVDSEDLHGTCHSRELPSVAFLALCIVCSQSIEETPVLKGVGDSRESHPRLLCDTDQQRKGKQAFQKLYFFPGHRFCCSAVARAHFCHHPETRWWC